MNESLLNRILKDHKRRTRSLALILCLSMIVSLGTFAGFHQTAIAKVYTREVLDCPYAREGAEPVAHVHNDDCYEGETLVCTLPEREAHTHDDTCYAESRLLNCGLEENPGHQHSEACFDENGELICQIPEGEGAHSHTEECYTIERALVCNQPELNVHVHDAGCFRTEEITVDESEEAIETEQTVSSVPEMPVSDPNADLETSDDWNREFENLELSGNWARDLVLVAATQQGRGESPNNFEAVLNDAGDAWVRHGYTRYGAWYGYPYAEWDAMFVSFCLRYAGIPAENVPNNPTAALMAESFSMGELFAGPDYVPAVGDLIFFDTIDDEITNIDHMGIVYHVDAENGTINTVEGDRTDAVATFGYTLDDEQIVGYGMLPQNPNYVPTSPVFMTTDEEEETEETAATEEEPAPAVSMPAQSWERTAGGIKVTVDAPEGAFPENTRIAVTPVNGNSLKDTVSDAVSGEVLEVQAVDITFFDAEGREIEPAVPIRVVMTPAATENAEEKTSVVHVDIAQQTAELVEQAVGTEFDNSEVVFDADAFTIYAIVYTVDFEYEVNGRIYEASFPGARDIALETVLRELGVSNKGETEYADAAEEDAAVQAFLGKIASAVSTDEEIVRVSDGTVRVLKDGDARIVITMQDGAVFSIDVSAEGETSVEAENVAISTVNDLYLPEEAAAYAEVLPEEQSESAIAAIRNEEPDPTAGTVPETAETPVETDAAPEEHAAAETAYQVFEIRLDNVDATEYEGFRVQVTLPENIIGKDFRLYHLHEGETTDITATLEMTTVATTDNGEMEISDFSFRTDDFSQFVLQYTQYTVDFHYEINGKAYEFNIPGGGFMSLEHLAEALGLAYEDAALNEAAPEYSEAENATTNEVVAVESADTEPVTDAADTALDLNAISVSEETKAFVANVANVEISDPSLLWIGKAESDITVGELKEQNAISVLYSAELTEEQIDAINAQTVEAGDWALVSILAFDTEETLTLTMTDGKQYVIRVTDARITTTVISASGETYEISVTYGADAQIHDGATLEVTEILPEDERYAAYYEQASQVALGDAESQGIELPVVEGMRMFDIEIHTDEGKIEPAAPVQVDIRLVSAKAELLSVVHFAEEGPEAMGITGQQSVETEAETTEAPEAVTEAESMSLNAMTSEVSAFDENVVPTETAAAKAVNEVHFTAQSFSVYTVVSVNDDNVNSLDQTGPYALVTGIANDRGEAGYPETWGTDYFTKFVNALAMNYNYGYTLYDGIASMGVHLWEDDGQRYVGSEATEWYFESAGNGNYYIYCLDGNNKRYIYQQGDWSGDVWTPNKNLAFTPANDPEIWRTTFSIIPNNDGTVLIKNIAGNWYMHNNSYNWVGDNNEWSSRNYMMKQNPTQDDLASSAYRFRLSKASEDYDSFAAKKISVQTVVADTAGTDYQYVIYRKFEDAQGNETLYALAHDGTFVRVYDGGDSIFWRETEKDPKLFEKYNIQEMTSRTST